MRKIDYDLLLHENKFHTHFISRQDPMNITMKNIQNHSHYEILYVIDGERILVAEKKQYLLNKNNIALIPPYTLHRTLKSVEYSSEKYKKYLINFTRDFIGKFAMSMDVDVFSVFSQNLILIQFDDEEAKFVENTMIQMLKYNNTGELCDEQMFRLLLCSLLTFFAKKLPKESAYKENLLTDKIITYMENNFDQDINLEVLAKQFYVSKYEISRMFVKNVGRIRIENSKKLLRETPLSITRISELAGFHSSSNFARVFKKSTGVSPVQYRKNLDNEIE